MRYVNAVLAALMVLFAAVQYNDPDALLWILVYLVPAVFAGLAAVRLARLQSGTPFNLLAVALIAAMAGCYYYWPQTPEFWQREVWWETETAREGMGMMIATVVLAVAFLTAIHARTRKQAGASGDAG
jgi:hypothetical protein